MTLPATPEGDLPRIPAKGQYTETARQERLEFLEQRTGVKLDQAAAIGFICEDVKHNTEALIGSVEVPVGVAGPLKINGLFVKGDVYAPLATTEGALVASVSRGATALSLSGGVNAAFLGQRMIRAPCFELESLTDALHFSAFVSGQLPSLRSEVRTLSRHAELISVEPQLIGRTVHVHFVYETGNAAGQNMTTTCTWTLVQWLIAEFQLQGGRVIKNYLIESNLSNDKKVTFQSFVRGRGVRVVADCVIPGEVTRKLLHVTPEQLVRGYQRLASGGLAAGMLGININIANAIAALFTATGQDIACVHESSIGHLHLELNESDSVYASLVLPSLVIGTVGGGTGLPQQHEYLELLGCTGDNSKPKLAEIIASFCLALDLSTLSALVAVSVLMNAWGAIVRHDDKQSKGQFCCGSPLLDRCNGLLNSAIGHTARNGSTAKHIRRLTFSPVRLNVSPVYR